MIEGDFSKYNGEGTQLRQAQLRMLNILIEVDKICRKHQIPYWIDFGTLLGAVRHKGFVPWDDDIDICVMNENYKALRKALIEELPEQFAFQDSTTDANAFCYYGRVRDKKSYCYYPYFVRLKEQGFWLDIFRVDRVGSSKLKEFADFLFRRSYREIHNFGKVAYTSSITRFVKKVCAFILHPFSIIALWIAKASSVFSKKHYLTQFTLFPSKCFDEKNIFPLIDIEFEGHLFMAPHNYDEHLRIRYGDYMKLPPEEQRTPILDVSKIKIW